MTDIIDLRQYEMNGSSPVILGVVAEFNPFHKGHAYLLNEARHKVNADLVIAAMSGNYVQRGVPAIVDKYTRTRMAIMGGADLVAEIPLLYATASAEYFAFAGVMVLKNLGCTHIAFGVETEDPSLLENVAAFLSEESASYQTVLKNGLKNGLSYPAAKEEALLQTYPGEDPEALKDLLSGSNNILAIEYLKVIRSCHLDLKPVMIRRKGNAFNDADADGDYLSATALRNAMNAEASGSEFDDSPLIRNIPPASFGPLKETLRKYAPVSPDDFMGAVTYALLSNKDLAAYFDVSQDLSNRIKNLEYIPASYEALMDALSSPNLAKSRVSRALVHILLNIRQEEADVLKLAMVLPYIHLLGKNKHLENVGALIKKASVPVILRLSEAKDQIDHFYASTTEKQPILEAFALYLWERDLFADRLYAQILNQKADKEVLNDYKEPFISL